MPGIKWCVLVCILGCGVLQNFQLPPGLHPRLWGAAELPTAPLSPVCIPGCGVPQNSELRPPTPVCSPGCGVPQNSRVPQNSQLPMSLPCLM